LSDEFLRVRDWDALYENNRTRGYKKLNWVPVPNKQDGDGYTELVSVPNGAAHLGAWLAILQVASRCDPRGVLQREGHRPHDAASLARMTRLPVEVFEEAIPRLLGSIGWLEIVHGSDVIRQDAAESGQFKYAERNGTERNRTIESNRIEDSQMLITPERIEHAQQALGSHRKRGDVPDEAITRRILLYFDDVLAFDAWVADIGRNLDPSAITGDGYGLYLADAQRWNVSGGRLPQRKRKQAIVKRPTPFDPRSITGYPPSTVEDTIAPETARRIRGEAGRTQ
jgi:hypothetical protein